MWETTILFLEKEKIGQPSFIDKQISFYLERTRNLEPYSQWETSNAIRAL